MDAHRNDRKPDLTICNNLIGGSWQPSREGRTIPVASPSDGEVFSYIQDSDSPDIDAAVSAARKAFEDGPWARMSATDRGRLLLKSAQIVADQ